MLRPRPLAGAPSMLAVISDLHLQQTAADCLRYRVGQQVRQIGVRRNVKASAFQRLTLEILEAAQQRESDEIHLVLAGDIFELHRAPAWFFGADNDLRPTDDPADPELGPRLRDKVLLILRLLAEDPDHARLWGCIREFAQSHASARPRLTLHYLPGNHDRLVNAWPETRQAVRALLGMQPTGSDPFPVVLDFTGAALPNYGVRVRHGHEYEPSNFAASTAERSALDRPWTDYLRPSLGDFLTVEVAMRLALAFRARYAQALRGTADPAEQPPPAEDLRQLYLALTEFDDVRPATLLADYLVTHMGASQRRTFELLRPLLRDAAETAAGSPVFRAHAGKHVPRLLLRLLPQLLKNYSSGLLERLVRTLSRWSAGDTDSPARRAIEEFRFGSGFRLVVAGHTHLPEQVPLAGPGVPPDAFYLNTGTWRTTLPFGVGGFGRLRSYTMVFAYTPAEQSKGPEDGRTFESWTGTLAADTLGPYDEEVREHSPAPAGVRQLRFETFEVEAVEREFNGAELRVRFGVDGQGRQASWEGVRPGSRWAVDVPPLPLDPDLDGDLWFHGVEVDWGKSPLDYDDPLPWALEPLPRDGHRGQFRAGAYVLPIRGRGIGGVDRTEFSLRYRIESV